MVKLLDIDASEKWIKRFQEILGVDDWMPVAFSEKLREDGESVARLSFVCRNGMDRILIGINKVSFDLMKYGAREKMIVNSIIDLVEETVGLRFAGLSVSVEADLGVQGMNYSKFNRIDDLFSVKKDGLDIERCLMSDSRYSINIFGIASHKPSWRYKMTVSTPALETFMWYTGADVKSFFETMDERCLVEIKKLTESDDAYNAFQKLKEL